MKFSKYFLLLTFVLPLVLFSCRGQLSEEPPIHVNPNMDEQRRFEPGEGNEFFKDNRAMRQPVEGTIARGNLHQNTEYYQGINEDSSFVAEIPVDVTKSFLYRGQEQYEIYCTPCHGLDGEGDGIIMTEYNYVPAPTFHQKRLRNVSDGHIYSAIANGIRTMPSYGHQIPVKDRWAIVAYVRALQRSQYVPEQELKKYNVDIAALNEEFKKKQAAEEKAEKKAQADTAAEAEKITAAQGRKVANNNACLTCHSTDGSKMRGPTWQGIFGHEVTLKGGKTITVDEDYLRSAIVNPRSQIVQGFSAIMPNYSYLSDTKVKALIKYIKSLSDEGSGESDDSGNEGAQSMQSSKAEPEGARFTTLAGDESGPAAPQITSRQPEDTLSASAKQGKELIQNFKCLSCHTIEEAEGIQKRKNPSYAPPFAGLFGSERKLKNDTTITVDAGYIKESIQYPGAKLALGYNHQMPSYKGLFSHDELEAIVDYFEALR